MSATPDWQPGAASAGMGTDLENLNLIGRDATVHSKVTWAAFGPLVTGQTWATFSSLPPGSFKQKGAGKGMSGKRCDLQTPV